jgi:hypothetical protein
MYEFWLSDVISVGVHALVEGIEFFFGIGFWEVDNFLEDSDVRSLELFD